MALTCTMALLVSGCAGTLSAAQLSDTRREAVTYAAMSGTGTLQPDPEATEGRILAGENAYLQLYYRESTAVVSVFDRRSGEWWHTNPEDGADTLSAEAQSQITIDSVDSAGVIRHYTSYSDSLMKRQVEFAAAGDRLTVTYVFGNTGPDLTGIPRKLTGERYAAISDRMDDTGRSRLSRRYVYDADTDIWSLKETNLTKDMTEKLKDALDSIGYTEAELASDHAAAGVGDVDEEPGGFEFQLEYRLQDDSLLVRIDSEHMRIPKNEYITSLNILKYFGALSAGQEGYLLLPDGSGALVDTKPVKGNVGLYRQRVYGQDEAMSSLSQGSNRQESVLLPVFGINRTTGGVLAVIEDNEASAYIEATGVGYLDNFATVAACFEINAAENIGLSASDRSTFWISTESRYTGCTDVRYVFLEPEKSDYSGMAAVYRQYLQRYGGLTAMPEESGSLPLFVETVGAVSTEVSTAGFLHDAYVPLTSYEDNVAMLKHLSELGVDTVALILSGWMEGGMEQPLAEKAELMQELGGAKGFNALTAYAAESQGKVRLYPEVLLNTMSPGDSLLKRGRYGALTLGQKKSMLETYDLVTGLPEDEETFRPLVSPGFQKALMGQFLSSFSRLGAGGLCIGDLAGSVYSDYNNKQEALRQNALLQSREIIRMAAESAGDILLRTPHNLSAPLSRMFSDVPASSSRYLLTSESVPFYQMVFHGAADYAMEDLNTAADFRESLLKQVEYGACPKFKFIYRSGDELRFGEYHDLRAADFGQHAKEAAESYAYINGLLEPVRTAAMIRHEKLMDQLYAVTYDNGYRLYVNYHAETVEWQGVSIPARDAVLQETGGGF